MTLPTTVQLPEFLLLHRREMQAAIDTGCRTCLSLVWIIIVHSDFKTGWFLGSYKRLQALMTPPKPERGPRPQGPSLQETRSAIDKLISAQVLWRDPSNLHNKQLRLRVWPRDVKAASADLTNSYLNRAEKHLSAAFQRKERKPRRKTEQLLQQGYQQLNSIPPTPKIEGSYPQPEAKKAAQAKIAEFLEEARRKGTINSPPRGRGQTP